MNMFHKVNESSSWQNGLRGMASQGVILVAASLFIPRDAQIDPTWIAVLGAVAAVAAVVLLTGAWVVGQKPAVLEGEIVEQQSQLPDVQLHMHCTPELPQAA